MKIIISLLFILSISFAQQRWIRTYGGISQEDGYSVQQTFDGGYIVAGVTSSFGQGTPDFANFYLIKTDSFGDTLWTKTYGIAIDEIGRSVLQTQDRGYIVVGYSVWPFPSDSLDIYLVKTDSLGVTLWTKRTFVSLSQEAYSVQQTTDGGYIVTGWVDTSSSHSPDMALIKYNASGDTIWTRTYGGSAREGGYSVQQTTDGGYIIGGETRSFGPGAPDSSNIYIIKTDSIGDTLWTKIFGGRGYDCCLSIQQTQDGGYIATGFTSSYGAGSWDIFILKMNASGDTLWTRIFGGVNTDCGYSIQQTTDGGYIVAGNTISFGTGSWEAYIVKMNASGDTLWTKTYGGVNFECGYSIQQTTDGGYIVAGSTNSYGSGTPNYNNVYLIKMDASGNATVEENKIRVQSVNSRIQAIPNPFTSFARIPGYEKDDFSLSDITGRLIGKYRGERIGENLPAGVYFIIPQNKNLKPIRIVKIR